MKQLKHQKGEINLQTIFWVAGILASIVAIVIAILPFIQGQDETTTEASNGTKINQ